MGNDNFNLCEYLCQTLCIFGCMEDSGRVKVCCDKTLYCRDDLEHGPWFCCLNPYGCNYCNYALEHDSWHICPALIVTLVGFVVRVFFFIFLLIVTIILAVFFAPITISLFIIGGVFAVTILAMFLCALLNEPAM